MRSSGGQVPLEALRLSSLAGFTVEDAAEVNEDGQRYPCLLLRKAGSWESVARSLEKELRPSKVVKKNHSWLLMKQDAGLNTVVSVGAGKKAPETVGATFFDERPTGIVKVLVYWRQP